MTALAPFHLLWCCLCIPQKLQYLGSAGPLCPWLRAQWEWVRSPSPHQVKGSVPPQGGAPAGRCGRARAAALHQLGGLRDLLREPGPRPGGLPDEPERLPELLDRVDRCAMPSSPVRLGRDPQEGACVPCPCRLAPQGWAHLRIHGQEQRRTPEMRAVGRAWSWLCSCVSPSPHAGQQEPDKDPVAFRVSPSSGLLEARPVNAPPTSVPLQVSFTARYGPPSLAGAASGALAQGPLLISAPAPHRSCELYESTLVVEGVLGEKSCTLRLQGRGSYDERYASPY